MALENPGENIDKAADGFGKIIAAIKSAPVITAFFVVIACAVFEVIRSNKVSDMVSVAKDEQRKEDNAYYKPIIREDDSSMSVLRDSLVNLKIEVEVMKQKYKKLDSLNNE